MSDLQAQAAVIHRQGLARLLRAQAASLEAGAKRPTDTAAIIASRLPAGMAEARQAAWMVANEIRLLVEQHDRLRPTGMAARINGSTRRWAAERDDLQRRLDAADERLRQARQAEDDIRERLAPAARRAAATNSAANAADMTQAARLRQIAHALDNGHFRVLAALRTAPIRPGRSGVDDLRRLHSAAASDDFPQIEGDGFDAVAAFFRRWSAATARQMQR